MDLSLWCKHMDFCFNLSEREMEIHGFKAEETLDKDALVDSTWKKDNGKFF